jgi:cytochrome c oxidase cbb3-type subunit III
MIVEAFCRACLVLALGGTVAACGDQGTQPASRSAEPAPLGALPKLEGAVIGTQPGPDRTLPEVKNPYAGNANALSEGRRLFVWYNCYGCHGGRGGGGMGPSLRDVNWLYGREAGDIFNSIAEGRPHGMPAWGTKLPREQIWKLTAYIKSMDTADEPDAPPANPTFPSPTPRRDVQGVKAGGGS